MMLFNHEIGQKALVFGSWAVDFDERIDILFRATPPHPCLLPLGEGE
jgi:hypothetical protein